MYYAQIRKYDVANWPWIRTSLFVSGCRHACPWCFNAIAWNFKFGKPYTSQEEDYILSLLKDEQNNWLTLLGWEPLEPENAPYIASLVKRVKETFPNKNIWCYSGFTFEEHLEREKQEPSIKEILEHIDVLVDWKFILEKKNLKLSFRGSENQRLINIPESLKSNQVVLLENYN